jgi:UDP-glucose 4-epimerase
MLLEYAKKTGCNKFVYASTMSVYGDHYPYECTEDSDLFPVSFYAVGKLASEHYMRIYSKQYGITCTALRLFNTYGKGQNLENLKQGMVSIYLAMALKEKEIIVKGSKNRFRDFVYIEDVVDAFIKAIEREHGYEVFNVCTGKPITVEEVIDSIIKELNTNISVEYIQGTPGDQFGICGNYGKISETLGWSAKTPFYEGLKAMIEWAKNNF